MKEYYNPKDIQVMMGVSKSVAYDIIKKLRERFEKDYPMAITIKARIPIWYFEEQMHSKRIEGNK